jgi:hypothetical protein
VVEGDAPRSHTCAHNLLIVPPELYLSREVVCKGGKTASHGWG